MLYKSLNAICQQLEQQFEQISEERRNVLHDIRHYIQHKIKEGDGANLTVICTHNSRRSHMGQFWLYVAAEYYGIDGIQCFSGGTEATAFHPHAIAAMQECGFTIKPKEITAFNPKYAVKWKEDMPTKTAYSKVYFDPPNPSSGFAAIIVCSDADEKCPIVIGADARYYLPFNDPKEYDGTPKEAKKYLERCLDIGREILYVFAGLRSKG